MIKRKMTIFHASLCDKNTYPWKSPSIDVRFMWEKICCTFGEWNKTFIRNKVKCKHHWIALYIKYTWRYFSYSIYLAKNYLYIMQYLLSLHIKFGFIKLCQKNMLWCLSLYTNNLRTNNKLKYPITIQKKI